MQFATLFLLATAVLARPTKCLDSKAGADLKKRTDNSVLPVHEKRQEYTPNEGASFPDYGRFVYPDELENNWNQFPNTQNQGSYQGSNQNEYQDGYQDQNQDQNSDQNSNQGQYPGHNQGQTPNQGQTQGQPQGQDQNSDQNQNPNQDQNSNQGQTQNPNQDQNQGSNQNQDQTSDQNQNSNHQTPEKSPDAGQDHYKDQSDNEGIPCSTYENSTTLDPIPAECMRPIFCDFKRSTDRFGCSNYRLAKDEPVNKEELIKNVDKLDCVQTSICKLSDIYNLP